MILGVFLFGVIFGAAIMDMVNRSISLATTDSGYVPSQTLYVVAGGTGFDNPDSSIACSGSPKSKNDICVSGQEYEPVTKAKL